MKNTLLAVTLCGGLLASAAPALAHIPNLDAGPARPAHDAGSDDDGGISAGTGGTGGASDDEAGEAGGCAVAGRTPGLGFGASCVGLAWAAARVLRSRRRV